jgi:transposase
LTSKLHLAVEQGQRPLSIVLTAGQCGDSPQFAAVLGGIRVPRLGPGRPRTRPDRVLADKAYSSRANRALLGRRGIRATIPEKDDQAAHRRARGRLGGRPPKFDAVVSSGGMPWSAGSTGSSGSGRWPPDTTSSPSATRPPCASPRSTSGYDF